MICSNCGKNISTVGKVCPYCNADKSKDVQFHNGCVISIIYFILVFIISAMLKAEGLIIVGFILYLIVVIAKLFDSNKTK